MKNILYLNIKSKKENRADEINEIANLNAEIIRLKDSLNDADVRGRAS